MNRYDYENMYVQNVDDFIKAIKNKSVIPHQVEIQPGSGINSGKLCWLNCPYCYGQSTRQIPLSNRINNRLSLCDWTRLLMEIAHGGVKKIIFAGYCTDPLNSKYIDTLLRISIGSGQVVGVYTKLLVLNVEVLCSLLSPMLVSGSYISISVDAGTNTTYNHMHGLSLNSNVFSHVKANIHRISLLRSNNLWVTLTYLVSGWNNSADEIRAFLDFAQGMGVDLVRFSFPQIARGVDPVSDKMKNFFFRSEKERSVQVTKIKAIVSQLNYSLNVVVADYDTVAGISNRDEIGHKLKSLSCFSRFLFPCVGYDGRLYPCAETSAPYFNRLVLGDMVTENFWDAYYNYDADKLSGVLAKDSEQMAKLGCICGRKELVTAVKCRNVVI
jgi:MoaA/NifB/PqqE/SkfB family radical SAM enzyme